MAKIKNVGHVVLGVRDPARSVKFYTEVLGISSTPTAIAWRSSPGASAKQYLHEARVAADVMRPLDLETPRLRAAVTIRSQNLSLHGGCVRGP